MSLFLGFLKIVLIFQTGLMLLILKDDLMTKGEWKHILVIAGVVFASMPLSHLIGVVYSGLTLFQRLTVLIVSISYGYVFKRCFTH